MNGLMVIQVNDLYKQKLKGNLHFFTLINLGIQQGSIRGLLLFLIHVNDILKCLNSGQAIMFADDTNLFFDSVLYTELFKKANEELHEIDSYCKQAYFKHQKN